ncbi:hypothetical protein [Micromonospora sp. NPDC005313]|uniref:hypothetical protein n=1 Tax=unclassified Micromonospora TaxID=2617518 RepID=UPI0033AA3EEC
MTAPPKKSRLPGFVMTWPLARAGEPARSRYPPALLIEVAVPGPTISGSAVLLAPSG